MKMKITKTKTKECVAVLTVLYKKNGALICVGSDIFSDWALYMAHPQPVVIQFARNENENLSWQNFSNYITL